MSEEMAAKFLFQFKNTDLVGEKPQSKTMPLEVMVRAAAQLGFQFTLQELQNVLAKDAPAAEADDIYELNTAKLGTVAGGVASVSNGSIDIKQLTAVQAKAPLIKETKDEIKDKVIDLTQQIQQQEALEVELKAAYEQKMAEWKTDKDKDRDLHYKEVDQIQHNYGQQSEIMGGESGEMAAQALKPFQGNPLEGEKLTNEQALFMANIMANKVNK